MSEFEGELITHDYVDDLVDEWHENNEDFVSTLEEFVCSNTGWSHGDFNFWVLTGRLP